MQEPGRDRDSRTVVSTVCIHLHDLRHANLEATQAMAVLASEAGAVLLNTRLGKR